MSKETLLKEFRKQLTELIKISGIPGALKAMVMFDNIEEYFSKSIDQTREETIREVEEILNYLDNNREEHQLIGEIKQSLLKLHK